MEKLKKEDYSLPEDYPMYDMCYCMAKCSTPCARKRGRAGICTVSDLSKICSKFKEE